MSKCARQIQVNVLTIFRKSFRETKFREISSKYTQFRIFAKTIKGIFVPSLERGLKYRDTKLWYDPKRLLVILISMSNDIYVQCCIPDEIIKQCEKNE